MTKTKETSDKRVRFCLNHIRKLREELRSKNEVIKLSYRLIHKDCFKAVAAILSIEIERQEEIDRESVQRIRQLFIDAGEESPL